MSTKANLIENLLRFQTKEESLIFDIYKELYYKIDVSFVQLILDAEVIKEGNNFRLKIPFEDYEIDENTYNTIVDSMLKHERLPKWKNQRIKNTILLGCSPKTI